MKKLINLAEAECALRFFACAMSIAALLTASIFGLVLKMPRKGLAIGLIMVVAAHIPRVLWSFYARIGNTFGYASVGGVVVLGIIFLGIGCLCGYGGIRAIRAATLLDDTAKAKSVQEENTNAS